MRILFSLFLLSAAWAQQPTASPAKPQRMPEPKNLKVLKVPPSELIPLMRSFNTALGAQCVHCHVKGDFASDENHHKEIARMMITMTQEINAKFNDSKTRVTCFTCHRGEMHPQTEAPAANTPPPPPPPPAPAP